MATAKKWLTGKTVVVTGASSGIGLATAEAAASAGANLILAARSDKTLDQIAARLEGDGRTPVVVPTDVADPGAMDALAERAVAATGRLDAWLNIAATSVYGTVEQLSVEEFEQVTKVTYLGVVYGCKAAVPRMRAHGGGTIVNVSSVLGVRAVPLQSAYSAAKAAVIGFTDALRMELEHERSNVRVGLVLPASTDTPFFDHAGSHLDVEPAPFPPVYAPEVVAESILHSIRYPHRRLFVGGAGRALDVSQRLSPTLTDWFLAGPGKVFDRQRSTFPNQGEDTVQQPSEDGRRRSHRQGRILTSSAWTQVVEQAPARAAAAAGGLVSALRGRTGGGRARS